MTNRIDIALAAKRSVANKESLTRGRKEEGNRMEPECWPAMRPKFTFPTGSKIFTIGSCFARNIEAHLVSQGFKIPMLRLADADGGGTMANQLYNKYTPPAIYQELKWAYDIIHRDDTVRESDVEPLIFRRTDGLCFDLHLVHLKPEPFDVVFERRKLVYAVFREAFTADVVVTTLGLIEAFWDRQNQLYVLVPPTLLGRSAGRLEFERLKFASCYEYISKALDLLDSTGRKKHLITTSPVTLHRTFTNDDVIVANMYSKSVLRAVAGQLVEERENVDYFPSFESVMLTRQPYVWDDDLQHVSYNFVGRIVARVSENFVKKSTAEVQAELAAADGELTPEHQADQALHLATLMQNDQIEQARAVYEKLPFSPLEWKDLIFHTQAARLMKALQWRERAKEHALLAAAGVSTWTREQVRVIDVLHWVGETEAADRLLARLLDDSKDIPGNVTTLLQLVKPAIGAEATLAWCRKFFQGDHAYTLGSSFAGDLAMELGRKTEAEAYFRESAALDPDNPDPLIKLANLLIDGGDLDEAVRVLYSAIERSSTNYHLRRRLGFVLAELGRQDEALEQFREASLAAPGDIPGRMIYARLLRRFGKLDAAKAEVEDILGREPSNEDAVKELQALEKAIKASPIDRSTGRSADVDQLIRSANGAINAKNFAAAVEPLRRAIEVVPNDVQLRRRTAYVMIESNLIDEALQQIEAALALEPNDVKTRIQNGQVLWRAGKLKEAVSELRKAQMLDPTDSTIDALIFRVEAQRTSGR